MVDGESAVLPTPAALDLDDLAASLHDEPELDETEPSASWTSPPRTGPAVWGSFQKAPTSLATSPRISGETACRTRR